MGLSLCFHRLHLPLTFLHKGFIRIAMLRIDEPRLVKNL